jgi:hypothetical protein
MRPRCCSALLTMHGFRELRFQELILAQISKMRFFGLVCTLAATLFATNGLPAAAQGQAEPPSFNDRIAAQFLSQLKESLQGHSQKKLLASFDLTRMKDGALFKQQINSFFDQTGTIRVHFNLQQSSTEEGKGLAVLDAEMEAEAIEDNAPSLHKSMQLRLTVEPGASGWKITDVQPRSFFSTQP